MSSHEETLKLVTNLDRAAIESRLADIRGALQSAGLAEAAQVLADVAGASREQLEQKIRGALKLLAGNAGQKTLVAQLELVEINLPNLK